MAPQPPAPGTSAATTNWTTNDLGTSSTTTWSNGNDAAFSAGSNANGTFTVSVNGTVKPTSISFEEGAVALSGGTLTTAGAGAQTLHIQTTAPIATINSLVSDDSNSVRLNKFGTGVLLLSNTTNSFTGGITANANANNGTIAFFTVANSGTNSSLGRSGTITLNGAALQHNSGGSDSATDRSITIGANGGAIDVQTGRTLELTGSVNGGDLSKRGEGTLVVSGTSGIDDLLINGGIFKVQQGGLVFSAFGGIASETGTSATAIVSGPGSLWNNSADLSVGNLGTGSLHVENGGLVSNNFGFIGDEPGSTGTATVSGAGSLLANSAELVVGLDGTGTLNVLAGGEVSNNTGLIGYGTGSTGTATVTGAGSHWTNSSNLFVGYHGTGTLNVQDGGQVSNNFGFIGDEPGSTGTATVSGAGSQWTNSNLYVGGDAGGTGSLSITAGGQVIVSGATYLEDGGTLALGGGSLSTATLAASSPTATVQLTGNDNTITITGSASFVGTIEGAGGFIKDGGGAWVLSATNTYSGDTVVNSGTLVAEGSITASPVAVNAGTLSGSGSISLPTTIGNGAGVADAILATGSSGLGALATGPLTFNSDALFQVQIDTDLQLSNTVSVTGGLTISGSPALSFTDLGSNAELPIGMKFTLIEYSGAWNAGTFAGYADQSTFVLGSNLYEINYDDGLSSSELTITVILDPSVMLGDMDGNGVVDNFDIQPFELALTNPDAYEALYPLATHYRQRGDLNQDSSFDNFDIQPFENFLTGNSGPSQAAAVPEPSSMVLAMIGLAAFSICAVVRPHSGGSRCRCLPR